MVNLPPSAETSAIRYTDIAVIGGGLSGSTAAAILGRAGISAALIDPHRSYPTDFRAEKISGPVQLERFLRTGIGESVLRRATFAGENWIARGGHLLDKAPSRQFNILHEARIIALSAQGLLRRLGGAFDLEPNFLGHSSSPSSSSSSARSSSSSSKPA